MYVIVDGRMMELLAKPALEIYQEYAHQGRSQAYMYCRVTVHI